MDFSLICSLTAAENACKDGLLSRVFLLPFELGGADVPENVVFIPPSAADKKEKSTKELIKVIEKGAADISVIPEYRGDSFVPSYIYIKASRMVGVLEYEHVISIWDYGDTCKNP